MNPLSSRACSHSALAVLQLTKSQVPSPTAGPPFVEKRGVGTAFGFLTGVTGVRKNAQIFKVVTWDDILSDFLSGQSFSNPNLV